jgi:soluble lytic murein transglycosylase-like protein
MCGSVAAVLHGAGAPAVSVVRADPRTGRLVRTVIRTSPAGERAPTNAIAETVDRIAQQNQLSPELVHSVIRAESNYDPNAVSPKGAQGLMQLIPSTARRFGVSNVFDPADNIQGGARYLKYLLALYKGDESLALAAYNAGEGAVATAACPPLRRRRTTWPKCANGWRAQRPRKPERLPPPSNQTMANRRTPRRPKCTTRFAK